MSYIRAQKMVSSALETKIAVSRTIPAYSSLNDLSFDNTLYKRHCSNLCGAAGSSLWQGHYSSSRLTQDSNHKRSANGKGLTVVVTVIKIIGIFFIKSCYSHLRVMKLRAHTNSLHKLHTAHYQVSLTIKNYN